MFKPSYLTLLLTLLWAASSLTAQTTFPSKAIDLLLDQQIKGIAPGLALGVVQNGTIVYEKYLGYANLEHQVPVNQQTRFNIASNAKQFTALCILDLCQKGIISLEEDIRKYLPEYYRNIKSPILIKHLLNHSSGIRDVYDLWALQGKTWWAMPLDNKDAFELLIAQTDLNFVPGSDYLYSNSNYILLTEIVKTVSEQPFSTYAQELFNQLQLQELCFLTNYMDVMPHKARPYANWGSWKEYPSLYGIHGDGALFSNLETQLQWEVLLQKNAQNPNKQLLNSSQQLIQNSQNKVYGFGLEHGSYKNQPYLFHEGSTGAYHASFVRFPAANLAVVALTNNGNISTYDLTRLVAELVLNDPKIKDFSYPKKPEKTATTIDPNSVLGYYQLPEGTIIGIEKKGDQLQRSIYQSDPVTLVQQAGNWYQYDGNPDLNLAFYPNTKVPYFMLYHPSLAPRKAVRLPESEKKLAAKLLEGRYYNAEIDRIMEIKHQQNVDFQLLYNDTQLNATRILPDLLLTNGYQVRLEYSPAGELSGLLVSGGRLRNVLFRKI